MYKIITLLIIAVLFSAGMFSAGCGKKDEPSVNKPNDNKTQNNQQQQTNQQQTNQKAVSYKVTAVDKKQVKAEQMVDFTWMEDGKEVKLSDYKGKVIVLNFWATWCPPCKKELPHLSQISTELKDKDFKMIGVSVDDNQEVLNSYLQSNGLSYTVVFEPNELVGKYMTAAGQNQNVVPQTYIIDKKGK